MLLLAEPLYGIAWFSSAGVVKRASLDQTGGTHDLQGDCPLPFLELRKMSGQGRISRGMFICSCTLLNLATPLPKKNSWIVLLIFWGTWRFNYLSGYRVCFYFERKIHSPQGFPLFFFQKLEAIISPINRPVEMLPLNFHPLLQVNEALKMWKAYIQ